MEGNKDEALRCICIAEEATALGNKDLKFIKITQRLNRNFPVDALLSMCKHLDSQSSASSSDTNSAADSGVDKPAKGPATSVEGLNGEMNHIEENVKLIREIKGKSDYYAILGLEKSCSVEEIKKAYRHWKYFSFV